MIPARPRRPRGFTLTEILVVLSIIAVLTGLLVAGVVKARSAANRFAVEQRVTQLSQAVESFKTSHGFYPPDFSRIKTADQFLPFLNRFAPNHSEGALAGAPHGTLRRYEVWWNQVGSHLGAESALTFWLSGLAKNQQFPLTYTSTSGRVHALPPYNVAVEGQQIERIDLFDFDDAALIPVNQPLAGGVATPPWMADGSARNTCGYSQLSDGEVDPIIYFELASYRYNILDPAAQSTPPIDLLYPYRNLQVGGSLGVVVPYGYVRRNSANVAEYYYYNKDSFQILTPGLDSTFYGETRTPIFPNPGPPQSTNAADRLTLLRYSTVYDFYADVTPDPLDRLEKDNLQSMGSGPLEQLQVAK